MACFCAAGIAHFCKLPRLPPRHQRPVIFLPIARIGPPPRRPLSKTLQPAFAAFCPVSKLHPFFAPCIFFSINQPFCKIVPIFAFFICLQKSVLFFAYRNFKGVFGFFYFCTHFSKTGVFLRAPQIRLHFNHTKRGGFFILSHQNSTLN